MFPLYTVANDFFEILPSFVEFIEQKNNYYKFDTAETNHCYELIKGLASDWGKKIKNIMATDDTATQIDNILNDLSAVIPLTKSAVFLGRVHKFKRSNHLLKLHQNRIHHITR